MTAIFFLLFGETSTEAEEGGMFSTTYGTVRKIGTYFGENDRYRHQDPMESSESYGTHDVHIGNVLDFFVSSSNDNDRRT